MLNTNNNYEKFLLEAIENYNTLPIYHIGQSKEIRYTKIDGVLIQKLIPSLSSITNKTKGYIENLDKIRNDITSIFIEILHRHNIKTCYLQRHEEYMLINEMYVPPIEVIIKSAFVGTPTKIYHNISKYEDRFGKKLNIGQTHEPYVRFDFRNPLQDEKGNFVRDECMPNFLANRYIDIEEAEYNALNIFEIIQNTLNEIDLKVLDCCLLFDETGRVLCSEISPDNMRIKSIDWNIQDGFSNDFDKDLWRNGVNAKIIHLQWEKLKKRMEKLLD